MTNYKLIAMDFDGTLLNDQKEVTNKTKEVLLECKKRGFIVVGVTARTLYSAENVVSIQIFDYLILNNGAYLYDVKNKTGVYIGVICKNNALEIIKQIEHLSTQIDLVSGTTYYIYNNQKSSPCFFVKNIVNLNQIEEDIARMNIFLLEQSNIEQLRDELNHKNSDINCFIMQDSGNQKKWLVVNPKGLDKKVTLENLGNKLGIELQEMIFFWRWS